MPGPQDQRAGAPIAARPPQRLHLVGSDGRVAERRAISVLYVEDDEEDVFLLRRQINALPSFRVDFAHASSLEAARAMTEQHRFDVVLCDFWLGTETTIPLIDELKLAAAPSLVVLVSSLENDDIELIGRRAGAAGFVAKADLSAAALDRIFATLLPPEDAETPAEPAESGVAAWLRALMRSLDAARAAGADGSGDGAAGALLADIAGTEAIRQDIVETLAGLERATRLGSLATSRFDAVPYIADAVERLHQAAGRPGVTFLAPAMPIPIEASPSLFGDLVQGFFAEAGDALASGQPVAVAPLIRAGRLVLEITVDDARQRWTPTVVDDETARTAAAAEARRFVVETLARATGGVATFPAGIPAGDGHVLARLEVPLRTSA